LKQQLIMNGANIVSMFCRLNVNTKKDLPLRSSEIGLLIYVVKSEKPVTPIMAAEFFKVSKPMIAAMVKTLVAKGYLVKIPLEVDRRSYNLMPTNKAKIVTETVYDEYFKAMQLLMEQMGIEKFKNMIQLLELANTILSEEKNNG
jgi:DNA-binding MarR family transcriptional regulator